MDFENFYNSEATAEILVDKIRPLLKEIANNEFESRVCTGFLENEKDDIREACEAADIVKKYLCSCVDGALAECLVREHSFNGSESAYQALETYFRGSRGELAGGDLENVSET